VDGEDGGGSEVEAAFGHGLFEDGRECVVGFAGFPDGDGEERVAVSDAGVKHQAGRHGDGRAIAAAPTGVVLLSGHCRWSVDDGDWHEGSWVKPQDSKSREKALQCVECES